MANLIGNGPTLTGGATSEVHATSVAPFGKGQRARDAQGNEYVYVEYTGTVYGGMPVQINSDYTAAALAVTGRGALGVVQGAATSNDSGWVQIYGRTLVQIGMGGVSPSDAANGPTTLETVAAQNFFVLPTTLSTPVGLGWVSGEAGLTSNYDYVIDGLWVAHDASPGDVSAVTSATSHTGSQIAVWLNFPTITMQKFVSTS